MITIYTRSFLHWNCLPILSLARLFKKGDNSDVKFKKILLKDICGNSIAVDIPDTPKPLQITEYDTEEIHWRKILTITLTSIIIGFSIFCFIVL